MTAKATTTPTLDPVPAKTDESILVDATAAAAMCDISRSAWYKLVSGGKTPGSVKLGRSVRWNRNELTRWIRAGCPARAKWEVIKATPKK